MPDRTLILLWLTPVIVCALVAWLFRREIRARAKKQSEDIEARYRRARGLCILYAILIPMMLVAAFQRHDQSLFKKFFSSGCFTVVFGIFFYQFLEARRKLRAQPGFARKNMRRSTPVFFWQAVLILLPVALMAGFGFWAILRERNAVEHEAQQRAKEIIRSLPREFGRIAARRLTQFDGPKGGWYSYLQGGIIPWPENKNRKQWLADTAESQIISNNLAILHAAFPHWQEGPVPLVNFSLNSNGDLWYWNAVPPRPPAWLASLTTAQLQAWADLQTAAYANESLSNYVQAFQLTQPPPPGLVCAEFMQLRVGLPAMSATNAINQLLLFAGRHYDVVSDSGIPLKTLALAEALKRAEECGPNEQLWESLQSEISLPTALSPMLLDEAGRLVAGDPQLAAAVRAMRILLADKLAQADLAEAVQHSGKLNGITTTNVWVNAMGKRWLCVLSPSAYQNYTTISNRPVSTIVPMTRVDCYPQSVVVRGFADALTDAKFSLPGYFSITLGLEGGQVPLPPPWSTLGDAKPSGDILAEETFQMSQRAGTTIGNSDVGQEQKKALFLSMPGSRQEGNNIFFEDMPSQPNFSLQIRLTDRSLLYTRQRQLQWIWCLQKLETSWPEVLELRLDEITDVACKEWAAKLQKKIACHYYNNTIGTLMQILQIRIKKHKENFGVRLDNPAFELKRTKIKQKDLQLPEWSQFREMVAISAMLESGCR